MKEEETKGRERESVANLMQFYGPEGGLPADQEWWTEEQIEEARRLRETAHEHIRESGLKNEVSAAES